MIVGITGGSGSGKSMVSALFAENGYTLVDADKIAKEIMKSDDTLKKNIRELFGKEYILANGEVDRKALGALVFKNKDKRELLNSVTHPAIYEKIVKQVKKGGKKVVLDVPLLIGSPLYELCDITVAVLADKEKRINRIMERDGLDKKSAENRINSQLSDEEYINGTDCRIYNNGSTEELKLIVMDFIRNFER